MIANPGRTDIPGKMSGITRRSDAKNAIARALAEMAVSRRYSAIRTGDLIRQAGIGRSTFYEHFRGKDDVLLLVIAPVLDHLANAASDRLSRAAAIHQFRHFWCQRGSIHNLLGTGVVSRVERDLAIRIAQRRQWIAAGELPQILAATAIAAGQLALIRAWLSGQHCQTLDSAVQQFLSFSRQGLPPCPA